MTTTITRGRTSKFLTIEQALHELNDGIPDDVRVARSTFQRWLATNRGPTCLKMPNGKVRIRRTDFDAWLSSLETRRAT